MFQDALDAPKDCKKNKIPANASILLNQLIPFLLLYHYPH